MSEIYRCPNCHYHDDRVQIEEETPAVNPETETTAEQSASTEAPEGKSEGTDAQATVVEISTPRFVFSSPSQTPATETAGDAATKIAGDAAAKSTDDSGSQNAGSGTDGQAS